MIISRKVILDRNENERIIDHIFVEASSKNNPAKIEVRLGSKCYLTSDPSRTIIFSRRKKEKIYIPPNEALFFQTEEKIHMPIDLAGRLSLRMKYVAQGILMPNATQIDPGYYNYIFGMIYNLSCRPLELSYLDTIATLEFFKVKDPSPETYTGHMQEATFESFTQNRVSCSLGRLSQDVSKVKKRANRSIVWGATIITVLGIIFAGLSAIIGIPIIRGLMNYDAVEYIATRNSDEVELLREKIDQLERQLQFIQEKEPSDMISSDNTESSKSSLPINTPELEINKQ